jgi:hypothetical protein
MNPHFEAIILETTGATAIASQEQIQTLWSGYGEIVRVGLQGAGMRSAIVKYIVIPGETAHPRGWNTDRSHDRKLKSYDVEMHWYRDWSGRCGAANRVAHCYDVRAGQGEHVIVLEDLDAAGFPLRRTRLDRHGANVCLQWLAHFHAMFMGEAPRGLWDTGSYWHLATRPDELAAMEDKSLQGAAGKIDALLNGCAYQTIVHGDAKVANFCFSHDGQHVAAVDFQYVGGGCGMKDVAYFLGSCLTEGECEQWENTLLDGYFSALREALPLYGKQVDAQALENEWRALYPVAWADFHRFLAGWMPDHRKITDYSRRLVKQVLKDLGSSLES